MTADNNTDSPYQRLNRGKRCRTSCHKQKLKHY